MDVKALAVVRLEERQEKENKALIAFLDEHDDVFVELNDLVTLLKRSAVDYKGFDLTKELEKVIEDLA